MLSRIKIRILLPALFGIVTFIAIAQGAVALWSLSSLKAQVDLIGRERMPRIQLLSKMDHSVSTIRRGHADMLLAGNEDEINAGLDGLKTRISERDQLLRDYAALITLPGVRTQFDALRVALDNYDTAAAQL
ncbi:MAG: methyl-accepting chemotaxis protein, partial [Alphaproteobacteria bacterium]